MINYVEEALGYKLIKISKIKNALLEVYIINKDLIEDPFNVDVSILRNMEPKYKIGCIFNYNQERDFLRCIILSGMIIDLEANEALITVCSFYNVKFQFLDDVVIGSSNGNTRNIIIEPYITINEYAVLEYDQSFIFKHKPDLERGDIVRICKVNTITGKCEVQKYSIDGIKINDPVYEVEIESLIKINNLLHLPISSKKDNKNG